MVLQVHAAKYVRPTLVHPDETSSLLLGYSGVR